MKNYFSNLLDRLKRRTSHSPKGKPKPDPYHDAPSLFPKVKPKNPEDMSDAELNEELDIDRMAEIMDSIILLKREQAVDAAKMAEFQETNPRQYRVHHTYYCRRLEKIDRLQKEYVGMRMKRIFPK